MNEGYLRTVVGAALEDLVRVRQAHGADSAAYQRQLAASLGFIQGSLEEVLTAARRDLHRRDGEDGPASRPQRHRARRPFFPSRSRAIPGPIRVAGPQATHPGKIFRTLNMISTSILRPGRFIDRKHRVHGS